MTWALPPWPWVKTARTLVMIGNGASRPLRWGPRAPETAVSASTSPSAARARAGRSHQGGAAAAGGSAGAGGSSRRPSAKQAPTRISDSAGGGWTGLRTATPSRNAVQPQSTLADRPGCRRDPAVDDHEGGQGGEPEQGAGGRVGAEVAAVEERLDQQDRAGDDR